MTLSNVGGDGSDLAFDAVAFVPRNVGVGCDGLVTGPLPPCKDIDPDAGTIGGVTVTPCSFAEGTYTAYTLTAQPGGNSPGHHADEARLRISPACNAAWLT